MLLFGAQDSMCSLHAPNERVLFDELRNTVVAMCGFVERLRGRLPFPGRRGRRMSATVEAPETQEPPQMGKFRFPSALTVLAIVTVAVWLLAFLFLLICGFVAVGAAWT